MNSTSLAEQWVVRLLPILSNLPFAWGAVRWFKYGSMLRAFHFMLIALVTSPLYHLCTGFGACAFDAHFLHVLDFWTAELTIPLIALYFIEFRLPYVEKWLIAISVVALGFIVATTESSFAGQAIVAGVSLGVVALYVVWYRLAHGHWPRYDLQQLTLGLGFTALGVCFFVVQEWWPPYYGYNHSYWHALVGAGGAFIVGIRPPRDPMLNLETSIQSAKMTTTRMTMLPLGKVRYGSLWPSGQGKHE